MTSLKPAREFEHTEQSQPALPLSAEEFASAELELSTDKEPLRVKPSRVWLRLAILTLLVLVVFGVWQLIESWVLLIHTPTVSHALSALVGSCFAGLGLLWLASEYRLWRRLKNGKHWQLATTRIEQSMQYGEAVPLCEQMLAQLPVPSQVANAFHQQVKPEHSDKEVLELFANTVLVPLDAKVKAQIHQAAVDTSLAVAISPFALADLLLVLWRSSRMLRLIAGHYGAEVGQLRSLVLLKDAFAALVWAGGSEFALDLSGDLLSSELTSKISVRAGQGVVAGLLVARLGLSAQRLMRPIALEQKETLSLRQLASALARRIKSKGQTE